MRHIISRKLISIVIVSILCILALVDSNFIKSTLANETPMDIEEINQIDLSLLPKINESSSDLEWTDPKIEMLIIAPDGNAAFVNALKPLADWKNQKGVKTLILNNYSLYEGSDTPEKIRNMIKVYQEKENIQWVLLAGDALEDLIPIRYVYNPDVVDVGAGNSEYSNWDGYLKPTDFYYADLTGTWDDNQNGRWGESAEKTGTTDEIDWTPDVYVGRLPADTASELSVMVQKTLKYEQNPSVGDWMNKMLLAGGISEPTPPEDEARLTEYLWKYYTTNEINFTHLYRATSSFTPTEPSAPNKQAELTHASFTNEFNQGYSTVIFAGHGEPSKLTDYGATFYYSSDGASSSNTNMPSLVYSDACSTNSYDKTDDNVGETLIKRADGGAIGFIGGLRVTWYFQYDSNLEMLNRGNAKLFWKQFFIEHTYQQGKALYDSKVAYMLSDYFINNASTSHEWERKNLLTYCLLGDPEVDIYTQRPKVVLNPFPQAVYEGQLISTIIKDVNNNPIPNARVNFQTQSGKYRTFYSEDDGSFSFRLPLQAKENYQVTITGHNVVPTYLSFTTQKDETTPVFTSNLTWQPEQPSVSDNLCFDVESSDSHSGLEGIYLLVSQDGFKTYAYQKFGNNSQGGYDCDLKKLDPGQYSFAIVSRDYANNTNIYENEMFTINLEAPISFLALIFGTFIILGVLGASIYHVYSERKQYLKTLERM